MVENTKKIRIWLPTPFDGTRENLVSFINECALYCDLNVAIYDTDLKKVIFMLSYMKGGTAQAWKESFITVAIAKVPADYGTIKDFLKELRTAFDLADSEGEARAKISKLRQGKDSVDEYISQFRVLAGKAKITDNKNLIEYFMEGINQGILTKIFALETLPTKIDNWYIKASKFDAAYRRLQEINERKKGGPSTTTPKRQFTPRYTPTTSSKDPNAMEVDRIITTIDRLTTEQREKHIRENCCFNCHRVGHRVDKCRVPKQDNDNTRKFDNVPKTPNATKAMIRGLLTEMKEEEKKQVLEDLITDADF